MIQPNSIERRIYIFTGDSLSYDNGQPFTIKDVDNDISKGLQRRMVLVVNFSVFLELFFLA